MWIFLYRVVVTFLTLHFGTLMAEVFAFKTNRGFAGLYIKQPAKICRVIITQSIGNLLGSFIGMDQQPFRFQDNPVLNNFIRLRQVQPLKPVRKGLWRYKQQLCIVCNIMLLLVVRFHQLCKTPEKFHVSARPGGHYTI